MNYKACAILFFRLVQLIYQTPDGKQKMLEVPPVVCMRLQTDQKFAEAFMKEMEFRRERDQAIQDFDREFGIDSDLEDGDDHVLLQSNVKAKQTDDMKEVKNWTDNDTKALLALRFREDINSEFAKSKQHTGLWKKISKELDSLGVKATVTQSINKFKALKRIYIQTVDANEKSGNNEHTCKFYDDFDRIFGTKDNARPLKTLSNIKTVSNKDVQATAPTTAQEAVVQSKKMKLDKSNPDDENIDSNVLDVEKIKEKRKRPAPGRKRREKAQNSMLEFLHSYTEEKKAETRNWKETVEKQHKEKMQRADRFLDILQAQTAKAKAED